jgi:F0F1-type ATP synthase membrane subunit b/b'
MVAILILIALAIFFLFKTFTLHHKREEEEKLIAEAELLKVQEDGLDILESCNITVIKTLTTVSKLFYQTISGLINEKRKKLKKALNEIEAINNEIKILKDDLPYTIRRLREDNIETGHYYIQVLNYLSETAHCLTYISKPIFTHVDNQRPPLLESQKNDLIKLNEKISGFYDLILNTLKNQKYVGLDEISKNHRSLTNRIKKLNKKQIKMIKHEVVGTKISILYLNTLAEAKNLLLNTVNLIRAQRNFLQFYARNETHHELIEKKETKPEM